MEQRRRDPLELAVGAFALCLLLFVVTSAASQEEGELIIAGPFGRPVQVADYAGNWSVPISIYSDDNLGLESFIPDITAPGWIYWNGENFRQTGIYAVDIYTYFKNDRWCRTLQPAKGYAESDLATACSSLRYRRRYIEVDTSRKTVKILVDRLMTSTSFNLDGARWVGTRGKTPSFAELAGTPFGEIVARITEIVQKECGRSKEEQEPSQQPKRQKEPQTIEKGQTTDQVQGSLGKPEKIVNLGPKQIYVYKDLKVTFINGRVADVQ